MAANWDTEEIRRWQETSRLEQNEYYNCNKHEPRWSGNPTSNEVEMQRLLGHVKYGPAPQQFDDIQASGYSKKRINRIGFLSQAVIRHFKMFVNISIVLVCYYSVKKTKSKYIYKLWDDEKTIFMDPESRIYRTWDLFLKQNQFEQSYLCFPVNGIYNVDVEGKVIVAYESTPAFNLLHRIILKIDAVFVACGIVGVALCSTLYKEGYADDSFYGLLIGFILCALFLLYFAGRFVYLLFERCSHY